MQKLETIEGLGEKSPRLTYRCELVFDGDGSEIINVTEDLGDEIDNAVETFAASAREFEVEEARVLTFTTDEGLFAPYGIADLEAQIVYEVSI